MGTGGSLRIALCLLYALGDAARARAFFETAAKEHGGWGEGRDDQRYFRSLALRKLGARSLLQ